MLIPLLCLLATLTTPVRAETWAWEPLDTLGDSSRSAPSMRSEAASVWTGHEVLVWGGRGAKVVNGSVLLGDGARYDPASDTWRPMSSGGDSSRSAPSARASAGAVWTGREMLVWGGEGLHQTPTRHFGNVTGGARYDPASDTWRPMATMGAPPPLQDPACVWTGTELVV